MYQVEVIQGLLQNRMVTYERKVKIGDTLFDDVTNQTVSGEVLSYYEAKVYAKTGEKIATSD